MKYEIGSNVRIGRKVMINCKIVIIKDDITISRNNSFVCNKLEIGSKTSILSGNTIIGSGDFSIGQNSRIIYGHYFDVWNSIKIGSNTWIAGKNSQFWTHGSIHTKQGIKPLGISIGDNVYVGSSCLFAPGTHVHDHSLVGIGSVVNGSFTESYCIIMGNPARIVKKNIDWRQNW
jgi:acetyltransferase-like isoleucine patch superfamily enzyme